MPGTNGWWIPIDTPEEAKRKRDNQVRKNKRRIDKTIDLKFCTSCNEVWQWITKDGTYTTWIQKHPSLPSYKLYRETCKYCKAGSVDVG